MNHWIEPYFPDATRHQQLLFDDLDSLSRQWNQKINVISRKDIDNLRIHHILHALSIARIIDFRPGTTVLDAGTGGGFPGIPLAILFPQVAFTLADSVAKKVHVVTGIIRELGLSNVNPVNKRFEQIGSSFDFITGRAVQNLPDFYKMTHPMISRNDRNTLPNGILYLMGGDTLSLEQQYGARLSIWNIREFFPDPYFLTKKIIHLPKP